MQVYSLLLVGVLHAVVHCTRVSSVVAPNHFLGTCLTDDWVTSMEKSLGVNKDDRDSKGRLKNPFLQPARKHILNRIDDDRTAKSGIFGACMDSTTTFYGVGSTVNPSSGAVIDQGVVNGSLIVELGGWTTHTLTALVFAIMATEVNGIPLSFYAASDALLAERMSSEGAALCTPTHLNLEVWRPPISSATEYYVAGDIGYLGRSGLYTTKGFVDDLTNSTLHANPLFADFWKGYKYNEDLIQAVPVSYLRNNSKFFPPATTGCADGTMGCLNHCSRSPACTEREKQGGECMVVAMMLAEYDPGFLQSVLSNIGIATYFCFIGYDGVQNYALDALANQKPVLFYHYEPDPFHIDNAGHFERVFLPRSTPERIALDKAIFGENGYGKATDNPVDVDFPTTKLAKYASERLESMDRVSSFVAKFSLKDLHLNQIMRIFHNASLDSSVVDPYFSSACDWIRSNYAVWTKWLDRLPMCDFDDHVYYEITGCNSTGIDDYRTIVFKWNTPNPDNTSESYECDGGLLQLPAPLKTSRSCNWILADPSRWHSWITAKPQCDSTFYKYNITSCDKTAKRTVNYWWLLPHPEDLSLSLECEDGEALPADVRIDCDYMPTDSPVFMGVLVIDGIVIALLVAAIIFTIYFRDQPIIKRSQWEFLVIVVIGGIIICVAAILYAGEPTNFRCGARPVFTALGFTTIFGALFVKSLRVYRVFMKSSFKRATVSSTLMIKVFTLLVAVDVIILAVWFVADFPAPTVESKAAKEFRGVVDHVSCSSASFIYNALLVFWKTIVLFMGMYSSFLIRNVSSDFQESIWMFASTVIVLIGCLVIVPLAYLVEMPAAIFYVFLAGCLLVCTSLVMSFMIIPKIHRLHAQGSVNSSDMSSKQTTGLSKVSDMSKRKLVPLSSKKYSTGIPQPLARQGSSQPPTMPK